MISQKYIYLVKNILLGKTWPKCVVELSNILFSQMFTCFTCARQNVAEKMEIIAGELPRSINTYIHYYMHVVTKHTISVTSVFRLRLTGL